MDTYYATCPKFHCFVFIRSVHRIQHERFSTKQHGYQLWYLSLDLSGNIAVSGYHSSRRTYIDLYESGNNSDSRDKLKLFYSKEFEKYSDYVGRYVSFLDKNVSKLVTCIGDKIKIIDTKNESKVLQSCKVNGGTCCLAVREGEIFIGLDGSQTVLMFNNDLKETKKIRIKGIKDGDYPCDLQVIKDTVFVCTWYDRALSSSVYDGSTVSEYTDTTGMYGYAISIAVSEQMNLVAVVWGSVLGGRRIIVYSLNKNKSFLVFDDDDDVTRIRISNRDRMIITGNWQTGEIKLYDLEQLFTFEAMKRTLAYIVSPEECEELRKYFGVTEEEIQRRLEAGDEDESKKLSDKEKTVRKMECLLTVIEEKGHLNPSSIDKLTDAVSRLGDEIRISDLKGPMEGYSLHSSKLQITMEESMTRQKAWEDDRNQLSSKLETAESKVKEHEKTLDNLRDQLMQAQEQEKTLREGLKDGELKIKELEGERMALTEELGQIKTLTEELEQTKKRKTESDRQIETLIEELKQSKTESDRQIQTLTEELKQSKTESHEKLETLTVELNETKQKLLTKNKELEITSKDLEMTKQTLKETAHDRDNIKTELQQYRLDFAKESKALKEVLNQAKEAMAEHQKRSVEDKPLVDSEETGDEGGAILAAEFGRLTVAIADHLTLEQCLRLANFFKIPTSDCYTMLPVSFSESPGMRLLDVLKKQNVINIFDVTNLQKALAVLHLEAVNHDLVVPYQEKIDEEQYELHKVEEMYIWEELNAAKDRTAQRQIRDSQTSLIDDTKPEYASETEATAQRTGAEDEGKGSSLAGRHHHQLYAEHSIGTEGGTIQIANVSLTVPPDALHESHVIALSVMNESPFPLDREVDTARMTPLLKLEPLGLKFTKWIQLNIPHSALIPEPDNHDVIIYSGQITKNDKDSSDSIRWTEERSVPRQLKEKSVTVDIHCLTYLSASLVSHTASPPLYIVRAVPFVDGVRNTDDDIILTICFCNDNDTEYNMLLSDYNTKLPLEQYSTVQLCRHPEKDEDDAGYLSVTVTSRNNSYVPDADQAVKKFSISHLCTASRVSHQLRLQKNREIDRDDVQVLLKFSQTGRTPTEIFMKARIKDLMISQESEDLLLGSVSTALKSYNELKANISSMLENHHCIQLATYFELTPAEEDRVKIDASPGRMLMKILDEREKIMPWKMFGLYQGLKVCHLDKIARVVFECIEKISNETGQEKHEKENDKSVKESPENASVSQLPLQKRQKTSRSSLSDQSVQTTLSSSCVSSDVHVKTLTKEGYTEHEVVEALDISRNRLVMARKVLHCLWEQSGSLTSRKTIITKVGGTLEISNTGISLVIPPNALPADKEEHEIHMRYIPRRAVKDQVSSFSSNSTTVVEILPNISLQHPVRLSLPHCLVLQQNVERKAKIFASHHKKGKPLFWEEQRDVSYHVEDTTCIMFLNSFSWYKYCIDDEIVIAKKIVVYTAAEKPKPIDDVVRIEVGCYPDLPEQKEDIPGGQNLTFAHKKILYFLKSKEQRPLQISLNDIFPYGWQCRRRSDSTGTLSKKIPYSSISKDFGDSCAYVLEKRCQDAGMPLCVFTASQEKDVEKDNIAVQLAVNFQVIDEFPSTIEVTGQHHQSSLKAETTVTKSGVELEIPGTGVVLTIPPNAIKGDGEDTFVGMRIIPSRIIEDQVTSLSFNACTAVELYPHTISLLKDVKLRLPHCLTFEENSKLSARIFKNFQIGSPAKWEKDTELTHKLDEKECVITLKKLCCVQYFIDDNIVESKQIRVYTAAKILTQRDKVAELEVGFYPDIPGGGELLRMNPNYRVDSRKKLLVGKQKSPLRLSLDDIAPSLWECWFPKEEPQDIPVQAIAASIEHSHLFILKKTKTSNEVGIAICTFTALQHGGQMALELVLTVRPKEEQPKDTSHFEKQGRKAVPTDVTIKHLSSNIGDSWKQVGRNLGFEEAILQNFESDHQRRQEQAYQMFLTWKQRNGSEATHAKLMKSLIEANRADLAEYVQLQVESTSSSADSVLKLTRERHLDENRTFGSLSITTHRPYTTLEWIKEHLGFMRYILPMSLDGILQTQRGVFTLPRVFKD